MPKHDISDPRIRAKLAKHYAMIARQAHRQRVWRERWQWFNAPRFAALDMSLVALIAAIMGVLIGYVCR